MEFESDAHINGFWLVNIVKIVLPVSVIALLLVIVTPNRPYEHSEPPYPKSSVISGISFDWETHMREAIGSDIWAITWADDDHQYASWGDGGGFGGTDTDGRVSIGIARIKGSYDDYEGVNVYGGKDAENPGKPIGYSWGIICLDGILYIWAGESRSEIYYSKNSGATWETAGWNLGPPVGPFGMSTFLNFGKNYEGAMDNYVYVYGTTKKRRWYSSTDGVLLARVPKNKILLRNAYEFFHGHDRTGNSVWTDDIEKASPSFRWPKMVHWCVSVAHVPEIHRYLLCFNAGEFNKTSRLVIFDAPKPWGPWSLVADERNFGGSGYTFSYHFAPKWWRNGGREFTLVYSGTRENDSWNTVTGKLSLARDESNP